MSGNLLANTLLFGRVLRGLGIEVGPGSMIDLAAALGHVDVGRRQDFFHTARCLLVRRREDLRLFDEAFDAFWRRPAGDRTSRDLRAMGERRRFERPRFEPAAPDLAPGGSEVDPDGRPPFRHLRPLRTWSAREVLRHKDFSELTAEELEEVAALLRDSAITIPDRPTRRFRADGSERLDLRATLRKSLRHGGEVLRWRHGRRRVRPRPLVALADISGSMERYTRLLLLFLHGLARQTGRRSEVFLFGTRLSRVTRQISGADADLALRDVARAVPDWSGGTRIGESIKEFNFRWARRVLSGGPVVLLISDGWDRGDALLLSTEIARLQRSCHRLVWLNPLAGSKDYEPLARGMQAALPHVDDFLPVHNLASLQDLARRLESLPAGRPARRRGLRTEAA